MSTPKQPETLARWVGASFNIPVAKVQTPAQQKLTYAMLLDALKKNNQEKLSLMLAVPASLALH